MTGQPLPLPIPYIGKHVERKHVEEFFGWHRESNEIVIAIVDGIIFDAQGKRVGGMTLHDYLILTDQALILWARGLQSDVMDRLDHSGISLKTKSVDALHGEISLHLQPPSTPQPTDVRVDLVPIIDLAPFEELFRLSATLVGKREVGQNVESELASIQEIINASVSGKSRTRQSGPSASPSGAPRASGAASDATRQAAGDDEPPPYAKPIRTERTLDSPFGTGRPVSDSSYSVYRVAQLARDAVTVLPQEIGKNIGLDETLSKLADRLPKVENLTQITELINALNGLLVTLSSNPAARAFALQAIDRMVEQGSPLKNILAFARNGFSAAASRPSVEPLRPPGASSSAAERPAPPLTTKRQSVQVSFGNGSASVSPSPSPGKSVAAGTTPSAEKRTDSLSLDYAEPSRNAEPELETVGA
jgi:hypothetical protein